MGKPTPSVKRGVEKEVKKGDPVQKQRDALINKSYDNTKRFKPISGLGSYTRGEKLRGNNKVEGSRAKKISNLKTWNI
mgnify:CR=1 FL=1